MTGGQQRTGGRPDRDERGRPLTENGDPRTAAWVSGVVGALVAIGGVAVAAISVADGQPIAALVVIAAVVTRSRPAVR